MRSFLFLSIFSILLVVISGPGLIQAVMGEDSISAVIAKDENDGEVMVTVRIVSSRDEGDVSVLVKDENGEVVLLETVALNSGFAEVKFTVDPNEAEGDYTAYVSGVNDAGEEMDPTTATFFIDPLPAEFIIFGYDGWMVIGAFFGLFLVIGMAVRRSGKVRKRRALPPVNLTPVVQPKTVNAKDAEPYDFKRSLTESREMPVIPRQTIRQEIHHHYAPQYDQSQKTENIVDSVYYRKKP